MIWPPLLARPPPRSTRKYLTTTQDLVDSLIYNCVYEGEFPLCDPKGPFSLWLPPLLALG